MALTRAKFEDVKTATTEELEKVIASLIFDKQDHDALMDTMLIECKNELRYRDHNRIYNCGKCGKLFKASREQKNIPTLYGDHFCSMDCYREYYNSLKLTGL
jgi:hypothetical protein